MAYRPTPHKCPVCEEYVFSDEGDFDICPICNWENDAVQYDDPNYEGGANWVSLNQARDNFKKLGKIMSEQNLKECHEYYAAHTAPDGKWMP